MSGLFSSYNAVVLDASFFVGEFSDRLQQELEQANIFVSETFNAEVAQHTEILMAERRDAYRENIAFLQQIKPLRTLSFGDYGPNLHNDTWGLVNVLAKANFRTVLVTADQLLIQRVVLSRIKIDIYDLSQSAFIYNRDFLRCASRFALRNEMNWSGMQHVAQPVGPGTILYRKNGTSITLGKEIGSGLEAHLILLKDDPNCIAKIFKKDRLPADKFNNILKIQGANQELDIDWALFPIDVVYYDAQCTQPAGFTEGFARTTIDLEDNPLYLGDINLPDSDLNARVSDTLKLCLKVVRQVRYLSNYGFMICDFNMGNFAMRNADSPNVQMWDTDSFGHESYFSGYCSGSATSREYDIRKKEDAIGFCAEALYLFVFTLLSLGDAPISEFTQTFKYDKPKYRGGFRKELFPSGLWRLFEAVFRGEKEPSVEMLLYALHVALQQCREKPETDLTYKDLLQEVLEVAAQWEERQAANAANQSASPTISTVTQSAQKKVVSTVGAGGVSQSSTKSQTVPPENDETGVLPGWLKFCLIFGGLLIFCYLMSQS